MALHLQGHRLFPAGDGKQRIQRHPSKGAGGALPRWAVLCECPGLCRGAHCQDRLNAGDFPRF